MKEFFSALKMDWIVSLIERDCLSYIDFALAAQLVKSLPESGENVVAFLSHLSAATRRGHLCIIVDDKSVWPHPREIWSENQPNLPPEFYVALAARIAAGRRELPAALLTDLPEGSWEVALVQTPLCCMGSRIYFQRYWMYEACFLQYADRFLSIPPVIAFDRKNIEMRLAALETEKLLLPAQAKGIANAVDQPLTIISGGPGTGKTYTAGQLIRIFWESLDATLKQNYKIALAAPTGKAASNLQKSLLKAAGDVTALEALQATTLHRLLGVRSAGTSIASTTLLAEDLIIVDESSMIDMKMMACLFAAIKPGARLILLGDKHQLPAVDAGAPFTDLIEMQTKKGDASVTELKICLRAELQEIVDFSAAVNEGKCAKVMSFFQEKSVLRRISFEAEGMTPAAIISKLCDAMVPHYKFDARHLESPMLLFEQSSRFRALSPMRKGAFGVEQMNSLMHKRMKKLWLPGNHFIAPIMVQKNDYRLEVFNGEVGLLVRPNFNPAADQAELSFGDYVLLPSKDGTMRSIPALLLPMFEYAYCLSVHKSQGSEFDHILLLLPSGAEHFGREVLYTAVTRARRKLDLWAHEGVLEATIEKKSYRLSSNAAAITGSD